MHLSERQRLTISQTDIQQKRRFLFHLENNVVRDFILEMDG